MPAAPVAPARRQWLIGLMEGVEDIPEPVLSAGIPWEWESFPDYMNWLSKRNFDIDIGAQLPHAALRVYVMGERGARRDPSTADDNRAMAQLAAEAVRAGALGFSTSRTLNHRTSTGDFTPTLKAGEDELTAIAAGMQAQGRSVLQFVLDLSGIDEDLPMMLRIADNTKCPISFSITQNDRAPRRWRQTLDEINAATARGLSITAQIAARPVGLLLGLELSRNPFQTHPSYKAIAHLPLAERLKRLRQPETRAAILSESASATDDPLFFKPNYDKIYLLGNPPDYEQPPENTLGAQARRMGRQPEELAYDAMLSDEGRGMLYVPFLNYADGNLDATREMLTDPNLPLGGPGGEVELIFERAPTFLLRENESLTLDEFVFGPRLADIQEHALLSGSPDFTRIAEAIARGESLDQLLEETSAGPRGVPSAQDAHDFVQLFRILEPLAPSEFSFRSSTGGTAEQTPITGGVPNPLGTGIAPAGAPAGSASFGVSLLATPTVAEGGSITYTATLTATHASPVLVTLTGGATISIAAGQLSGTVAVPAPAARSARTPRAARRRGVR